MCENQLVASVCGTPKLLSVSHLSDLFFPLLWGPLPSSQVLLNDMIFFDSHSDLFFSSVSRGTLFLSDVKGHNRGRTGLKQPSGPCTSQLLDPLSSWHTGSHMPVCFVELVRACWFVYRSILPVGAGLR